MNKLDALIDEWFYDRGIAQNGTPLGQYTKVLEEVQEILDGISRGNIDDIEDGIGDAYVTLRGLCLILHINFDVAVEKAYNEIKDRKGYLRNDGVFVKEEVN